MGCIADSRMILGCNGTVPDLRSCNAQFLPQATSGNAHAGFVRHLQRETRVIEPVLIQVFYKRRPENNPCI